MQGWLERRERIINDAKIARIQELQLQIIQIDGEVAEHWLKLEKDMHVASVTVEKEIEFLRNVFGVKPCVNGHPGVFRYRGKGRQLLCRVCVREANRKQANKRRERFFKKKEPKEPTRERDDLDKDCGCPKCGREPCECKS